MSISRLLIKSGLMLGGLFAVLVFLPGPNGKPMMSVTDLPGYGLFASLIRAKETAVEMTEKVRGENDIYQWVDEQGVIHFSDQPVANATVRELSEGNDPIPSKNFTGQNYQKKTSGQQAQGYFIGDSRFKQAKDSASTTSSVKPADFEDLIDGDYSNAREIVKELPQYLQEQHNKRMQALGE